MFTTAAKMHIKLVPDRRTVRDDVENPAAQAGDARVDGNLGRYDGFPDRDDLADALVRSTCRLIDAVDEMVHTEIPFPSLTIADDAREFTSRVSHIDERKPADAGPSSTEGRPPGHSGILIRHMTSIRLQALKKAFGTTTAVAGVDLHVTEGDLFFLLGPSGCGKTTILRMLAGFITPTSGRILFDDDDVTYDPPEKRNTGMVFQSYALWPHMSVMDNVGYGLNVRGLKGRARRDRAMDALRTVQMEPYADRKPNELSGGQQQRVALARALVIEPRVLLLDEPLSNLDAKLRLDMRLEIKRICKRAGITTVYVTHDQKEALSMADQVAVLRAGELVQVGPPRALYERPTTSFVADFLGETNFLRGRVTEHVDGGITIETPAGALHSRAASASLNSEVTCSLRPEALRVVDAPASRNAFSATRVETIYLGEMAQHLVELKDGTTVKVLEVNPRHFGSPGDVLQLTVDPDDVVVVESTSTTHAVA